VKICGYRGYGDLAHLLGLDQTSAEMERVEGPSFSLPGDAPRYAPDRPADVRHIDIAVTLDFERHAVHGEVTTRFAALFEQVREVTFDAAELRIERVTLAGSDAPLDYWGEGEKLHVRLDRAYAYGEEFGVNVRYTAHPRTGLVFVDPVKGNPDLPVQVWTQGETEYHHYWFPCHDFPNDRATTTLSATVPGHFFVLSNGGLESVQEHADGTKTYTWRMEQPYPAYLVTLVAGEFVELQDAWRTVPVNYYVRAGREADGHRMFDKTPAMIEYFSTHFGVDYPYVKYGQIVAEEFLGAMENASATTHTYRLLADERASLDYSPEPVVAHELVHQWHGDMLAVRDWSHTWLKESFATYFEAAWKEHDKGQDEFRVELRDNLRNYLAADARGRRPIVYNVYRKNGQELFDRHVYEKGSLVLHMLRNVLGEQPFWRALQHYTQRNQWREVITADFERAIEEATGRSVAQLFEQWVYKAGHPEFKVSYAWDDEHKLAKLTVRQMQTTSESTPVFVTPVDMAFMVPDTDEEKADDPEARATLATFRVTIDSDNQTFYFPLARRPFSARFDQGGWLIKTLEFERPSELLRYQLRHDPDVLGRIEAAEGLGKQADPQSIEALEAALFAEQFWGVRAVIADQIGKQRSERALKTLLRGLEAIEEPKARRAIVAALGEFRAPEQAELAQRAAEVLTRIVREGEPSYYVEAAAATGLGKTRTPDAFQTLAAKCETSSWVEIIRGGVFAGLGELGEARSVDVLADWLLDRGRPMDARAAAAGGLRVLAATKRIDAGEAQTKAVEALMAALDDPWEMVMTGSAAALGEWGDARAIPALERLAASAADERAVRVSREALRRIRQGRTPGEEARTLRSDLDALREENRKLRERIDGLEARAGGAAQAAEQ
jgi:aminopeptidase N